MADSMKAPLSCGCPGVHGKLGQPHRALRPSTSAGIISAMTLGVGLGGADRPLAFLIDSAYLPAMMQRSAQAPVGPCAAPR